MAAIRKTSARVALGAAIILGSFIWDGEIGSVTLPIFASPAEARVGRPLTPVSYAGVARRTTRRVVATTAVVAAPPPPTTTVVVVPPPQPTQ